MTSKSPDHEIVDKKTLWRGQFKKKASKSICFQNNQEFEISKPQNELNSTIHKPKSNENGITFELSPVEIYKHFDAYKCNIGYGFNWQAHIFAIIQVYLYFSQSN